MCLDVLGLVVAGGAVVGLLYVFREFHRSFDKAQGRRKRANSIDSV